VGIVTLEAVLLQNRSNFILKSLQPFILLVRTEHGWRESQ